MIYPTNQVPPNQKHIAMKGKKGAYFLWATLSPDARVELSVSAREDKRGVILQLIIIISNMKS